MYQTKKRNNLCLLSFPIIAVWPFLQGQVARKTLEASCHPFSAMISHKASVLTLWNLKVFILKMSDTVRWVGKEIWGG